ncbi:phytanoyl-CoA dioxygenase family protein [Archangium lansingense]|uniref:Phytanoyl-CoA dioxygenase family protein n=1 Tax=Archangium lansingense TaxID=2995310 RepID=A0ABT4APM5_9BACT|nr:phytanoyl-CoA dioxygenase family protein [Archangium lansinium]MCY1082747.1 phytanoyl-CoA dioxygenase family protein [Archangium lansinium]
MMNGPPERARALSEEQVHQFIQDGFVRLDRAFPRTLADECRAILWRETGCNPDEPKTWTRPVVRLGEYAHEPFRKAANTPLLHAAFDQLVGVGRWLPRMSLGSFPVRFPSPEDPGDTGWHVDASFPGEDASNFFAWRVNVASRGRALLMLFLFSDVGEKDAPTRIRIGSHLDVARLLEPAGDAGLSFMELAGKLDVTAERPTALATGEAGTVYLCHPFLVHAAQPHQGSTPRFLAQPPLFLAEPIQLHREEGNPCPVESAIRLGLQHKG